MKTLEKPHTPTSTITKSPLLIRPAKWEDMETIAGFIRSTAEWYRPLCDEKDMAEHEVGDEWKEKNFKHREFYIGYDGSKPVGTISIQQFGDYAYLGYIYLDSTCVGKGYGRNLMTFAKEKIKDRGLKGMYLISHPEAEWAVKAYTKFGFKVIHTNRQDVLAWNNECLKPYYEEGFHLFLYKFE